MRISSTTIFESGVNSMLARQQALVKTQSHISTGRRILTPADDPVAASQMLDLNEAKGLNKQYSENASAVKTRLGLQENSLAAIVRLVQDVKSLAVQAGNGAFTQSDLRSIATEVEGRYQELLGLANATDSGGEYLFAGFSTQTRPFVEVSPGVVAYVGDEGRREVAVSASRKIALNDSGSEVLQRIKNGNGTFATAAAAGNTGTGVISPGSVTDATALTAHDYTVSFTVAAGVTRYSVLDATTATTLVASAPYVPGGPIVFDGQQIEIDGAPANGDSFSITPSANVSLFSTLELMRGALRGAGVGAAENAGFANAMNAVHSNLQNALDRVLSITASVGTRLREADAVTATSEDLDLNYEGRLSQLGDLDYARAISDLNFQQLHLDAAQKSFMRVSELSLFGLL